MSRPSLNRPRHPRAVWDRTTTDTRLLPSSLPIPVSLRTPLDPLRMSIIASAPSRPSSPQRHCGVDARVHSPRMITHGSYPMRACPTTVDARALSRMISRSGRRSGCPRSPADDFPLRLHWRRSGCPRSPADDFPLRPHRRTRSGCLRLPADDFPRPGSRRRGQDRRGSAGNHHPHPVPFPSFLRSRNPSPPFYPPLSQLRNPPNPPYPSPPPHKPNQNPTTTTQCPVGVERPTP